jgi:hypothetical protein
LALSPLQTGAADPDGALPPILQSGLALWTKGGVSLALDAWQKGGLLEGDRKIPAQVNYFKRLDRALGDYKSCELIESKKFGQNSQIIYLSLNFARGAVYGRFVLYLRDKNWVVQNMDFSTKPEAIMPWLAFEGGKYNE